MSIAFDCELDTLSACKVDGRREHRISEQKLYTAFGRLFDQDGRSKAGTYLVRLCKYQIDNAEEQMWDDIREANPNICVQCGEEHQ